MSSIVLTLEHFSQPTTVCESTAKVRKLLTLTRSGQTETIVMVDKQGYPLGVVSWRQVLHYVREYWQKSGNLPEMESVLHLRSLLLPLKICNSQMTVREFLDWLERQEEPSDSYIYGLVDQEQQFKGLLNTEQLWRSLLGQQEGFWQELLDQLPIPLLMGRGSGQIIKTNQAWQEQIGNAFALNAVEIESLGRGEEISLANGAKAHFSEHLAAAIPKSQSQYWQASQMLAQQWPNSKSSLVANLSDSQPTPIGLESESTGSRRVWQLIKIPLSGLTGLELSWLIMARDVTEQEQCCQELACKNADLVYLNRMKDEFLSCISHELKSPLTAVIGLSTLLKEGKVGTLNSRQSRYADLIYQSGRQLMTLVNDLLDLTRLETGQMKLNPTAVGIRNVCQRAYQTVLQKYQGKGDPPIPFTLKIEPNLNRVLADEIRLQQMLVHLLDNAMKFSQEGGEIGLKVNLWEEWLAFTVWDTGIGIPEEFQPRLFEKFQQLESPLTRQFEGTGLGLALTQRLAKAHGGDVSFISQVGQGSQFTILLPLQPQTGPAHTQPEKPGSSSHPLILVVEAMPAAINHLGEQLSQLGYPVVVAHSGTEALEKARQLHPRRIFLNPFLPLLSGWDVLTLLKSDARTASIPVIITAPSENQFRSEQENADGFLALPVEPAKLKSLLGVLQPQPHSNLTKLTVLQLHLHGKSSEKPKSTFTSSLHLLLGAQLSCLDCRLLEADSIEQGEMIAGVWDVDVVILDGSMEQGSLECLHSLSHCESLARLPLITLEQNLTEAANQISNLSIFPCLLTPTEDHVEQLIQVIQIAVQSHR